MDNEYEVKVTRQALEHMRGIVHYISYDLMNPKAADNLLDDLKSSILKLSVLPKKHPLIEEVFQGDYIGVNPDNPSEKIDLKEGYIENEYSSAPTFKYILKDIITVE